MAVLNSGFATVAIFYLIVCCVLPAYQKENNKEDGVVDVHIDSSKDTSEGNKEKGDHVTDKADTKTTVIDIGGDDETNADEAGKHASVKKDKAEPVTVVDDTPVKPEEKLPKDAEQTTIGDFTAERMYEFTEMAMVEIKRLDGTVIEKKNNLVTAALPMLDKFIEPSKKLMEHNVCGPDLASKLDEFMRAEYDSVRNCSNMMKTTGKFHTIVNDSIDFLDDLLVGVVKEVSICEQLKGAEANDCFLNVYHLAEHKKSFFQSGELVKLKQQAAESMDKLENYWMGCTLRAMSAVKKVNSMLEKKLKCCERGIFKSGDCFDLKETFVVTLQIKPENSDLELYYVEIKHEDSGV